MSDVVVLVEPEGDGASLVSLEALTVASGIGQRVHALVLGDATPGIVQAVQEYGAASVHEATDEGLQRYAAAAWGKAIHNRVDHLGARAVVAGGSPKGMEVLAHAAARMEVPMAANVVDISGVDPVDAQRQVAGGAVLERVRLDQAPAVFTIAGHAFEAIPADAGTAPEHHRFEVGLTESDVRAQVVSVDEAEESLDSGLATARVVVGVGRAAGGADGFDAADQLAQRLGGVVGVSRVVTSMGWRPHHEQVGQSGTRISPDVYLAFGISGAAQHWAGCSSAKTIIAINTDAEAPMVTKADYAVIGDMHDVLPAILEAL
ncbi:MAG TPA: electron transfer flavoprotein subunit alpha/FixB family protein [Beutenbergiaceae bacterium]|nr:electron transfer flavoprotein subunit alpha/FixB family protein [Beutenbergiaceae bacterium]